MKTLTEFQTEYRVKDNTLKAVLGWVRDEWDRSRDDEEAVPTTVSEPMLWACCDAMDSLSDIDGRLERAHKQGRISERDYCDWSPFAVAYDRLNHHLSWSQDDGAQVQL